MNKFLLYPVTARCLPMIRFVPWKSDDFILCSFEGSSLTGSTIGKAYEYDFLDNIVYSDEKIEALIQKISTVVLLPLESNYNLTVLRPKLKRIKELAVEYGKEILDFTEENPKLFPLCPNPEGTSIKDIKQAVVSIGGMLDASRTFELFMAAFSALK